MVNPDSQSGIRLRKLWNTPEDISQLQSLLERSADYQLLTSGLSPGPHEARDMMAFDSYRFKPRERHLIVMELETQQIGYTDILRGFPVTDKAVIVDFVLIPDYRGRGLGRLCYDAVEQLISQWEECRRIRIGVLAVNSRVLPFWQKMGFIPTGECFPETVGNMVTEAIVFEKDISPPKGADV